MKLVGIVLPLAFAVTILHLDSYMDSSVSNPTVLANIGGTGNQDQVACDGSGGTDPPDAKPDDADDGWPCV